MSTKQYLLDIENISVRYPEGGTVLSDISLQVNRAEIVSVSEKVDAVNQHY